MRRCSIVLGKKPVIKSDAKGAVSQQLKKILNKKQATTQKWEPLVEHDPRRLLFASSKVNKEGSIVRDPHAANNTYLVPDQEYVAIPVPAEFKDAYWARESISRRVQKDPYEAVSAAWKKDTREYTDFQELSFRPKFRFSIPELLAMAKRERR